MTTRNYKGLTFKIEVQGDHDRHPNEDETHGKFSGWTLRDPEAGEKTIAVQGHHRIYYDYAGTLERATSEAWGPDGPVDAVERDMERIAAWYRDEWAYVGIVVQLLDVAGDRVPGYQASLWGLESDDDRYLETVTVDLMAEVSSQVGDRAEITHVQRLR